MIVKPLPFEQCVNLILDLHVASAANGTTALGRNGRENSALNSYKTTPLFFANRYSTCLTRISNNVPLILHEDRILNLVNIIK